MGEALGAGVRMHQLRLYVDNHLHDRYLAAPLAVMVAALLTQWVPVWQAVLWASLELAAIVLYVGVYLRFLGAAPGLRDESRWARRIAFAHGLHMVLWSSIVVWVYQPGNAASLMFVMLVHVGLISLTAVMSTPYRSLLLSDMAVPAVALVAPPLIDGSLMSLGLSVLGALYISLMLMVGLKIHAGTAETLVLRLRNEALIRELEQQARCDGLTGLTNRKHFLATGHAELERAMRYRYPVALLMLDIDHFKQINDTHGHLAGDAVLKAVAQVCQTAVRANDCLARLGGEEFAVLMPETPLEQATVAAERLRAAVERMRCELPQGIVIMPRMSLGVAIAENGAESLSSLMRRGDRAMYQAKANGRNRVAVASAPAVGFSAEPAIP